jgi:hypothetical protein
MKTIKIKNILKNTICIFGIDGTKINKIIKKSLDKNEIIKISFEDILIVSAPFLSEMLGDLYQYYSEEKIEELVKFVDFADGDTEDYVNLIKKTAKEFYNNN